ncbi:uncharacterized protein LOC128735456 [Sabethes cyaneus]|uniref:uncharacterized protein LOC128735456 n=1 Tax=Sabethes cyaneus TaxID=53552 RepID=UPI00237EA939|nr:uncharacterized protein LOC128735456 [Sabethes cyaneus]
MKKKGPPTPPKTYQRVDKPRPSEEAHQCYDSGISVDGTRSSESEAKSVKMRAQSVRELTEKFSKMDFIPMRVSSKPPVAPPKPPKSETIPTENGYDSMYNEVFDDGNIYDAVSISSDYDEGCYDLVSNDECSSCDHPKNAVEELLQNERKYVDRLQHNITKLVPLMYQHNIPNGLRFQKNNIFANIESIHAMHRDVFLPAMENCDNDSEKIALTFIQLIEDDTLYCYVLYALNKHKSERICDSNMDYLKHVYSDLTQFLLEPVQRLPRYRLLLKEMSKEANRTGANMTALDKAERLLSRLIELANAAVNLSDILPCPEVQIQPGRTPELNYHNDLPLTLILRPELFKNAVQRDPINLLYQGKLQDYYESKIYDYNERRRYRSKIFLFENLLLYTEIVKSKLEYRGHYLDCEVNCCKEEPLKLQVYSKLYTQKIAVHFNTFSELRSLEDYIEKMRRRFVRSQAEELLTEKQRSVQGNESPKNDARQIPEIEEDTGWLTNKLLRALVLNQQQFCNILQANYEYYLAGGIPESFSAIYDLHYRRVLPDLSNSGDLGPMCDLFLSYLADNVLAPVYNEYLREFKTVAASIKMDYLPMTYKNQVAPRVKDFVGLCIDQLKAYSRFFNDISTRMAEDSSANRPIDMELFRKVAFTQKELNQFVHNVGQNYKLFNMDQQTVDCGLVQYSEMVQLQVENETPEHCRLFINERAAICVSIHLIRKNDKTVEQYGQIVFIDKFSGRGKPMRMRRSKKTETRLNFVIDSFKYRIIFNNRQDTERFSEKYIENFVIVK